MAPGGKNKDKAGRPGVGRVLKYTLLGVLVFSGVLFVYNLSHWGSEELVPENLVMPDDAAVVKSLRPVLSWKDDAAYKWRVRLWDGDGRQLLDRETSLSELIVPPGLLAPSSLYRWEVQAMDRGGVLDPVPRLSRTFFTSASKKAPGLEVFPASLVMDMESWVTTNELSVSCPFYGRVELGSAMVTSDGRKSIPLNPSGATLYLYFDWRLAPSDPLTWPSVKVVCGPSSLEIPVVLARDLASTMSGWADSGFDLIQDTPSFANFDTGLLGRLTQGTCLGIALVVKYFYEQARFGTEGVAGSRVDELPAVEALKILINAGTLAVPYAFNFRHWSETSPYMVQQMMSVSHLDNINPLNLPDLFRAMFNLESRQDFLGEIRQDMEAGDIPLISRYRIHRKRFSLLGSESGFLGMDSGHAMLAARMWSFTSGSFILIYDPNMAYEPGADCATVLFMPASDQAPRYFMRGLEEKGKYSYFSLPGSKAAVLFAVALNGLRKRFDLIIELGRDMGLLPR